MAAMFEFQCQCTAYCMCIVTCSFTGFASSMYSHIYAVCIHCLVLFYTTIKACEIAAALGGVVTHL